MRTNEHVALWDLWPFMVNVHLVLTCCTFYVFIIVIFLTNSVKFRNSKVSVCALTFVMVRSVLPAGAVSLVLLIVALEQHDSLGGDGTHAVRVQVELLDGRHHDLVRRLLGASER